MERMKRMRKYFEYEINESIKKRILSYYSSQKSVDNFGNENGRRKTVYKLKRIEKYIPFSRKSYVCDIGCSDGSLLYYLKDQYKRAAGFDISPDAIKQCRQYSNSKVRFQVFDGIHIQTDELFDIVFIMDVLEHAFEPDKLMESIYKNLKNKGILVIQVPTTGWFSEFIFGKYHLGHLRYYDENYLKRYLESYKYQVLHIETFNSVPFSSFFLKYPRLFPILDMLCKRVPHNLYPYFGSVAAVAEKSL